jgi:hypothetical protein
MIREEHLLLPGMVAGGVHGYRRTGSLLWSAAWACAGYAFPLITVGVAFYQGFGKRKETAL